TNPARESLPEKGRSGPGGELVEPPHQVVQAALEQLPLDLRLGCDLLQPRPEVDLDVLHTPFERAQRVVPLALKPLGKALEPRLDLLHRASRDLLDLFGEDAVRLAREPLDREVELAPEPPCSVLARRLDRLLELDGGRLCEAGGLARHDAPDLLDLTVLDVP